MIIGVNARHIGRNISHYQIPSQYSSKCSVVRRSLLELGSRRHVEDPVKFPTGWSHHSGRQIFRLFWTLCSQQLLHHLRLGFPHSSEDTALGRVDDLIEERSNQNSWVR